ncbi:aspartate ammonia-lyase, partial [bacterium]|nr:aspartate ammonia-lyase [bacterium]
THLMDAMPVRLGQELAGYSQACSRANELLGRAEDDLLEVPLGGTAVGTGVNRHAELPARALAAIFVRTGARLRVARDPFEAQAFRDACASASAAARTAAGSLAKIANDLRLMASGPHGGLGEIVLPSLQPGSSIMPGKVNPVIPEVVRQIWARIVGNDATCALACSLGELELNVLMPVMGEALLDSLSLLERAATLLREKCVEGIEADLERCRALLEKNPVLATALAPRIGYERAAEIAKRALLEDRTILEIARELNVLGEDELRRLLDPRRLTEPGS